jgi:DNA-binding transcriptional ArsR family regulator
MASAKYIELNLNDKKAEKVAEVLSNKTAKKILGLLADKELSESDISSELRIPLNTVGYNIHKLIESGLIEKTSSFFWSVKGKKIPTYRVANKKIIISTKNSFKSLFGSALFGGLILGGIKLIINYSHNKSLMNSIALQTDYASESVPALMAKASDTSGALVQTSSLGSHVLIWVIAGIAVGCLTYFLYKKMKGGMNKI